MKILAVPLSQDIDGMVELRRPDGRQESKLQEIADQLLTSGGHCRFIYRGSDNSPCYVVLSHAASTRLGTSFGQCKISSSL